MTETSFQSAVLASVSSGTPSPLHSGESTEKVETILSSWSKDVWLTLFGSSAGIIKSSCTQYVSLIRDELFAVLSDTPRYKLCILKEIDEELDGRVSAFTDSIPFSRLRWTCFDRPTYDEIYSLATTVATRNCVFVGHPSGRRLKRWFRYQKFVEIPPRNAILNILETIDDTLAVLDRVADNTLVVFVNGGVVSPILIHAIAKHFGNRHSIVDTGNMFNLLEGNYDAASVLHARDKSTSADTLG